MDAHQRKQFVLIVPDGAADVHRIAGASPLAMARPKYMDFIACEGVNGRARTLYPDLPRESMVALLGILGWDPCAHYPHGRSSCELLARGDVRLGRDDLAFRANFVLMEDERLVSYNARYIHSEAASRLVQGINHATRARFPELELHHNSDFRNTLVVRRAGVDPRSVICPLPHERQGDGFDLSHYVAGTDRRSQDLADRINDYICFVRQTIAQETANAILPWSPSVAFTIPRFGSTVGFKGRAAVVGAMDFLAGLCIAGGLTFDKRGNGRPDTPYDEKGRAVVEWLERGYQLVVCHINAPDEASHMGDVAMKVRALQLIDEHVCRPVVDYFLASPERLGGVMLLPDHYTNTATPCGSRREAHSIDPVPFALWNNRDRDDVESYCEDAAVHGRSGATPIPHLGVLNTLLGRPSVTRARRAAHERMEARCLVDTPGVML